MLKDKMNIYFSGINGIGMSGLAQILKSKGFNVSGSDIQTKEITKELENQGINVNIGQIKENIKDIDLFVYSTAIKEGNPEFDEAKKIGVTMIKRGQLLAELMNFTDSIAVAGTHGKTTTSSMLSVATLEKEPSIVVGGIIPEIASNSMIGKSNMFIAEADESDNSFLYMNPKYSIVTNIEPDHLENHGSYENIKKSFEEFINKTEKLVLLNDDCPEIKEISIDNKNIVCYSIKNKNANIYAENIKYENKISIFNVIKDNKNLGEFRLSIPGEHNISNALPVIYLADYFGCDLDNVKRVLHNFKGANRRYQILYDNNIKIIDDYAHHPTEIRATLESAKNIEDNEIIAVFQPHRYSRTQFFLKEFAEAFDKVNKIYLMPIYGAGEENTFGISSQNIADLVDKNKEVKVLDESEIEKLVIEDKNKNNIYIFMGAGSISSLANKIATRLEE